MNEKEVKEAFSIIEEAFWKQAAQRIKAWIAYGDARPDSTARMIALHEIGHARKRYSKAVLHLNQLRKGANTAHKQDKNSQPKNGN